MSATNLPPLAADLASNWCTECQRINTDETLVSGISTHELKYILHPLDCGGNSDVLDCMCRWWTAGVLVERWCPIKSAPVFTHTHTSSSAATAASPCSV